MRWVGQQQELGCSIAACAMVLDLGYDEVRTAIDPPIGHAPGTLDHDEEGDRFRDQLIALASQHGFGVKDVVRPIPELGHRYIAAVKVPEHPEPYLHSVAIDEEGMAFDPASAEQKQWSSYNIRGLLEIFKISNQQSSRP